MPHSILEKPGISIPIKIPIKASTTGVFFNFASPKYRPITNQNKNKVIAKKKYGIINDFIFFQKILYMNYNFYEKSHLKRKTMAYGMKKYIV